MDADRRNAEEQRRINDRVSNLERESVAQSRIIQDGFRRVNEHLERMEEDTRKQHAATQDQLKQGLEALWGRDGGNGVRRVSRENQRKIDEATELLEEAKDERGKILVRIGKLELDVKLIRNSAIVAITVIGLLVGWDVFVLK